MEKERKENSTYKLYYTAQRETLLNIATDTQLLSDHPVRYSELALANPLGAVVPCLMKEIVGVHSTNITFTC